MVIITHPDNEDQINEIIGHFNRNNPGSSGLFNVPFSVTYNPHIPSRNIEYQWEPPEGDRFCEYGSEDEEWMRPLNIGNLRPIDNGPLFYMMDESKFNINMKMPLQFKP